MKKRIYVSYMMLLVLQVSVIGYKMGEKSFERRQDYINVSQKTTGIVLFYKDDCPDCQQIFPKIFRKSLIGQSVRYVNLNNSKNVKYINKYDLKSVPTFVRMNNGRIVESYSGTNWNSIQTIMNSGGNNEKS